MAIKKSRKSSKQLSKARKIEATKPLATNLFGTCCSGKHIPTGKLTV